MKIYNNFDQCQAAAQDALKTAPEGAFIDTGSYKGGMYDCLFILHPLTGETIFEGAY
jgi:hypothetical protein